MERPTSVTVFGVLNLVFGGLGLICTPLSALVTHMGSQLGGQPGFAYLDDPVFKTYSTVSLGLGAVVSCLLIAAGIGLLKLKPWARTVSIGYAIYCYVALVAGYVVSYFLIWQPMLEDMAEGPEGAAAVGGIIGGVFGGCFGMIYPTVLLVFMLLPSMRNVFYPPEPPPLFAAEPVQAESPREEQWDETDDTT
jgi:hypothetical protein